MSESFIDESMIEMYLFEMLQGIEQLETAVLSSEKSSEFSLDAINEIFRIMHTIKGASAMMSFTSIASCAHYIEDLFYFLREQKPLRIECSILSDLVFEGVDFIKVELQKVKNGDEIDGEASSLIKKIEEYLARLKQQNAATDDTDPSFVQQSYVADETKAQNMSACENYSYKATIYFQEGCEMENVRAYAIIHKLKEIADEIYFSPEDIIEDDDTVMIIREHGFQLYCKTEKDYEEMQIFFNQTVFLRELELIQLEDDQPITHSIGDQVPAIENIVTAVEAVKKVATNTVTNQSIISVSVNKLDQLMDLMGEMVISEAMVTQNPDLKGLALDNFQKAARQLHKITSELQDTVMSIRMVPLSTTFHKMHRVVRDMSKKLEKDVELQLIGETTEVDKNIIEHISDPLMHLIRNAIDHGIESATERISLGKKAISTITLEAKNAGSDVVVLVRDDGKGLNKEKILSKARENNLLFKPEDEMSDKEIYSLIFLPGFSTKENISEFSGRGVGMDVVTKNIESVGGSVSVDSVAGVGSTVTLKIPLTLAIIDGMNIKVGHSCYTIPTIAIKESFRPKPDETFTDLDQQDMIMVRGQCYPIIRLHERFCVNTDVKDFCQGILVMVEQDGKIVCLFADQLLGQHEVVVKPLPNYIRDIRKIVGIAGCTLLGDGSISLILDIGGLVGNNIT
ncbi:MAG: chemotaxis protein CheA [Firmicutes bacterium]|nr:chemotaxis protein CheA [Bacillota bacterium]